MRSVVLVLLLAGCSGVEAGEEWAGVVDTLPNGAVRVSNPAQGLWREGSGWQLVSELQLGSVDGPEPLIFSTIAGLAVDAEDRIYVLDREANELRIFTRTGEHVRTVGRAGEGPGEYRNANGLVWLSPDTLVVVDQRGERYSVLTREGEFVRSVPRMLLFYAWVFQGGHADGRIYELASVGHTADDRRGGLLGTPLLGGGDSVVRRDTVLLPVPAGPAFESFSIRTARAAMVMGVPFTARPAYHLDAAGTIWHGHGNAFRVARSTLAGDTIMEIVLDAEPAPVTAAELAEWERSESTSVNRFRAMGGQLDLDRIPKVKPFFDGLYRDPEGYIWASVPAGPQEAVFAVFDSGGRFLGRLQASGFRRNAYVPPVVRNGRLHLAGQDELDVPKIYVFRIAR